MQMTLLIMIDTFESVLMENELDVRNVQDTSHHAGALSCWLDGAGVKRGMVPGETDNFEMKLTKAPVHSHAVYATILHLPGMNQERLTFRHSGRYYRVTDVEGKVVNAVLG